MNETSGETRSGIREVWRSAFASISASATHERRQELRRLICERSVSSDRLTRALLDSDWEIRATAMLGVARLKFAQSGKLVRTLRFPATRSEGLDHRERGILNALRSAVLEHLRGVPMPAIAETRDDHQLLSREQKWLHLRRCVAGLPVTLHDQVFLLVNALTQPCLSNAPPPELPAAVFTDGGEFRFRRSGLPLRWIPPEPHWLGSDEDDLPMVNFVRRFTPATGYFIAQSPLTPAQTRWIETESVIGDFDSRSSQAAGPYLCGLDEAIDFCERLAQIEGIEVRLPVADEWEAAARGTDGRRHPWGNGFEGDPALLSSPWGLQQTFGIAPQWVRETDRRELLVCGDDKKLRCAARVLVHSDEQPLHAVRPVVCIS